jgi:poly(hydroxyalkanoate) depolymerase family esterase
MRSKTDLIKRMARFRHAAAHMPVGPGQDRLSDLDGFGANPGALRARTYVPAALPPGAPLVVVLHGCTQTAAGYDHAAGWSRLADQHGFALLFPEQRAANNPNLCFNWFLPGDTRRDSGEALSIRRMIEAAVVEHGIDRGRIFVNGLSAGGAMAAVMLATYPEVFAGGAIIAGLPYGGASSIPEAFALMRGDSLPDARALEAAVRGASDHEGPWPIVSIWHGTADSTVNPSNADAIGVQWRAVHGLADAPSRADAVDGHARRVWCDAAGRAVIEEYSIAGMAHGTPLSAADGVAGPFMLDVGISSTRHIAAFWGVAPSAARTAPRIVLPRVPAIVADTVPQAASPRPVREPEPAYAAAGPTSRVGKVIEDALRAAGLMR